MMSSVFLAGVIADFVPVNEDLQSQQMDNRSPSWSTALCRFVSPTLRVIFERYDHSDGMLHPTSWWWLRRRASASSNLRAFAASSPCTPSEIRNSLCRPQLDRSYTRLHIDSNAEGNIGLLRTMSLFSSQLRGAPVTALIVKRQGLSPLCCHQQCDAVPSFLRTLADILQELKALRYVALEDFRYSKSSVWDTSPFEWQPPAPDVADGDLALLPTALLASKDTLKHVSIRCSTLGDVGLECFAASLMELGELRTIDFSGCRVVTQQGVTALSRVLALHKAHVTRVMFGCHSGTANNLSDSRCSRLLFEALEALHELRHIDVSGSRCGSSDEVIASFRRVIEKHARHLRTLMLASCDLGPYGSVEIATSLSSLTSLTHLDMGSNSIGISDLRCRQSDPATALGRAISAVSLSLKHLDLSYNQLGPDGTATLCRLAFPLPCLETLFFGANDAGVVGGSALALVLPECLSLRALSLPWNNLGDAGLLALHDPLTRCPGKLTTLDLHDNNVSSSGLRVIEELLDAHGGQNNIETYLKQSFDTLLVDAMS